MGSSDFLDSSARGHASTPIWLVEDDARLAELVRQYLEGEGFAVRIDPDGSHVLVELDAFKPELIILDVMLPEADGFDLCRQLRSRFSGPIVMLTARDDDIDEVLGLELGADDYLTKPVRPRVLLARIRNLLGRIRPATSDVLDLEPLQVIPGRREIRVRGKSIDVTSLEYDLIEFLAQNAGRVISRDALYRALRNVEYDGIDRSLDLMVSRLRKKLGPDEIIKTVRGSGYMVIEPAGH
ncbi:MAG: response regulator transcription factor [Myxococcota bacterium]